MRPQPTLKIVEVFPSVQGEGLRLGEPTIFIRLAGCNKRCAFCDTKYAWRSGMRHTLDELLEGVRDVQRIFPCRSVCLTGGEPHLQDPTALVRALRADGFFVQVETNGSILRPLIADWYTVSPKPPRFKVAPAFRRRAREVKLVVTRDLAWREIRLVRRSFPATTPILLQPQSNYDWSSRRAWELLKECLNEGLTNVRLSVQAHKILDLP